MTSAWEPIVIKVRDGLEVIFLIEVTAAGPCVRSKFSDSLHSRELEKLLIVIHGLEDYFDCPKNRNNDPIEWVTGNLKKAGIGFVLNKRTFNVEYKTWFMQLANLLNEP